MPIYRTYRNSVENHCNQQIPVSCEFLQVIPQIKGIHLEPHTDISKKLVSHKILATEKPSNDHE